jgi:hypothetical protein
MNHETVSSLSSVRKPQFLRQKFQRPPSIIELDEHDAMTELQTAKTKDGRHTSEKVKQCRPKDSLEDLP